MSKRTGATLAVYPLRDVPLDMWRQAKARAAIEGRSVRDVIIAALTDYASKSLEAPRERRRKGKSA